MRYLWRMGDAEHPVAPVTWHDDGAQLHIDGAGVDARIRSISPELHEVRIDGHVSQVYAVHHGDATYLHGFGRCFRVDRVDPIRQLDGSGTDGEGQVRAPMPGVVVSVDVVPGQKVSRGERLLAIESMKLLSEMRAPCDGLVEALHVAAGEGFERDALLVELRPLQEDKEVAGS